jgi:Zn-dependent protease with chaperone function
VGAEGGRALRTSEPARRGWYPIAGQPGRLRWWDGTRWTEDEFVVPGSEADSAVRHPAAAGRRSPGHVAPDRIGILAGGRHLDSSAVATLVPALALLPISLIALAAFWVPLRLLVPVPFWAFAVAYLAAGLLLFLRPVQQLLLRWLFGARRPTPAEMRRLRPVWDDIVRQAGFPRDRFVLAVVESDELNAFACGGHVVATSTAALALLPDDELHGVLAHELGHHLGLHTAVLTVSHWLSLPIATLARIGFGFERVSVALSETLGQRVPALGVLGRVLGVLFQLVAWVFLVTVMMARRVADWLGRSSEFAADRRAVAMGYGRHLVLALRRVQTLELEHPDDAVPPALFASHPSPTLRMARIEAMLRQTH